MHGYRHLGECTKRAMWRNHGLDEHEREALARGARWFACLCAVVVGVTYLIDSFGVF